VARHRSPVGIFEAALLLVVAAGALWLMAPIPRAKRAAEDERAIHAVLGTVAGALETRMAAGRGPGPVPIERLVKEDPAVARALQDFQFSGRSGVLGNRHYWIAVLLPGREGLLAAPGDEDPSEAARGFCVVAWPRDGAPAVLRELAALPEGVVWQRAEGVAKSGFGPRPPVPGAAFPPVNSSGSRVPPPPADWTLSKKWR
jgi:hypothetical protein